MARARGTGHGPCLKGALARGAGRALSLLPDALVPRVGTFLSRIGPLVRRRARIARANLVLAFPGLDAAARDRLLRRTLASNTTGGLDTLRGWFAPASRLRRVAGIDGLDVLAAALAEGRGAVVIGAHYDSIELAMRVVADAARVRGIRSAILVRRYNDPCLEASIDAARLRYVVATIDKKDVSGFCGAVAGGGAVFYVPDQDAGRGHAFVPFFGVPAATVSAMGAVLARSGGVPLLMWSRRDAGGRLLIDLSRAPADFLSGTGEAVAARYTAWVEARVREAPDQYLWVHRRYKTRPPGEPDVYGAGGS